MQFHSSALVNPMLNRYDCTRVDLHTKKMFIIHFQAKNADYKILSMNSMEKMVTLGFPFMNIV